MDDVIDYIDDASQCISTYNILKFTQEANALSQLLCQAADVLKKTVVGLRDTKDIQNMRQEYQKMHDIENQGILILRKAIGRLFEEEKDTRQLIKWKEIYELLESAIDRCEDVSSTIEVMILEST